MAIKRLNKEELINKCKEIFYNHMSSGNDLIIKKEIRQCNKDFPTPMDLLYKSNLEVLQENENRLRMCSAALENNKISSTKKELLKEQANFLLTERNLLKKASMTNQKENYEKTKDTSYSRSIARISLNKKINSYYDDLILEVLFYDNISLPIGEYKKYKSLKTKEEKVEFIKNNTEITHIGLAFIKNNTHIATFVLLGEFQSNRICMLPSIYADFSNLTLAQTMSVTNNDLRQFLQARIDMDKEDLLLRADKMIGNDNYKIYENTHVEKTLEEVPTWLAKHPDVYYIRYVCPSTGRVYYNSLNLSNLALSKYFKENDFESYIDAWWSINNVGRNPNSKAMIRC